MCQITRETPLKASLKITTLRIRIIEETRASGRMEVSSIVQVEGKIQDLHNEEVMLIQNRYPDVAANGDNIATYNSGNFSRAGGTSASTPIFASIINRINEARLNVNKTSIGFINPALYAHPEILNDITNGTNPGCGTVGFSAVPGWDPVTGLGECFLIQFPTPF
jgi:hypothetical protein